MSIEVTCLQCGASHRVNHNLSGRRIRCPECDTVVHVPEIDPADLADPTDLSDQKDRTDPTDQKDPTDLSDRTDLSDPTDLAELADPTERTALADPQQLHVLVLDADIDDEPVLVRSKRPDDPIDMTPMVDVTFLLLIFFMVTAAFSLQKSIQMPRQQTDAPSNAVEEELEDLDLVEIQIDEFGSFLVMAPAFERETPGKQNLLTALREAIAGAKDGMKLDIKVHEQAKLRSLVEAMDAGTIAGYSELKVTQVEEFD
jgi:biopolymer transport protein ExbD